MASCLNRKHKICWFTEISSEIHFFNQVGVHSKTEMVSRFLRKKGRVSLKFILCQNKSKLIPNSYPGVYTLNCSCNAEYIGETKKKVITRTIEHQQDSIKGKWESSGATEHCLECHGQFNWLHPKTLSRETRYKSRKIRESL